MRKALVVGNWKMHGRINQNIELIDALVNQLSSLKDTVDIAICPPLVYIDQVGQRLASSSLSVGAQDVSRFERDGAHTGDCSALMLADLGVEYVLVGHSERRSEQGDSNDRVSCKLNNVLLSSLVPILCIGESLEEREAGQVEAVISNQLMSALKGLNDTQLSNLVIAYEPIWAIGTGITASADQAQSVHAFIRQTLLIEFGKQVADNMTILYGGSVKATNAEHLFKQPDIDGGLIGGAALIFEEFTAICRAAASSPNNG